MGWTPRSAAVSVLLAMEDHRKQAGLRLVRLREERGWNQEDLAHHSGLSVKTISRFENGRHDGRRATIKAITDALKVNESDLLGELPIPLGLGPTQLDRIEANQQEMLRLLRALSGGDYPEPPGELGRRAKGPQPKKPSPRPGDRRRAADGPEGTPG